MEVLESPGKTLTLDRVKVQLESYKAFKEGKRIVVNQGGTRSGKTFGLMKLLIALAYKEKYSISITSLSFPHLRKGALRDWRTIMENYDLYSVPDHMRTENTYYFPTGSYMEFFSVDDHLKVRGPGRDILFINEANLIDFDTFTQLLLRTKVCCFIDYNPADEFHWIYDKILTRPDTYFIKSTYQDNPFLPHEQVKEIENLKNVDENYWRIYSILIGNGQFAVNQSDFKPLQLCPKCNGKKVNVNRHGGHYSCDICNGTGLIPMAKV